jgi:hypothetical protein
LTSSHRLSHSTHTLITNDHVMEARCSLDGYVHAFSTHVMARDTAVDKLGKEDMVGWVSGDPERSTSDII